MVKAKRSLKIVDVPGLEALAFVHHNLNYTQTPETALSKNYPRLNSKSTHKLFIIHNTENFSSEENSMQIKIRNWDRYNPKRDQSSFTWLRLNNDIFSCQDFIEYDAGELAIYIAILCEASKKNSGTIEIKEKYITQCARCDSALFKSTLNKLTSDKYLEIIEDRFADAEVREADAEVREATAEDRFADAEVRHTTPTDERTNVTNETDVTNELTIKPDRIIAMFNEICAGRGKIRSFNSFDLPREALMDFINRTGDLVWRDPEKWKQFFLMVESSEYLTGKTDAGFTATLPWLLKPDKFENVLGGLYGNRPASRSTKNAQNKETDEERWARIERERAIENERLEKLNLPRYKLELTNAK